MLTSSDTPDPISKMSDDEYKELCDPADPSQAPQAAVMPDGQLVLILEVVAPSGCPAASHNVTLSVRRDMGMQVRRKRRGRRRGRVRISMHSAIAIERACVHANVRVCWSC